MKNQKMTKEEKIFYSFETLLKVRECMRTIEKEQDTHLTVSIILTTKKDTLIGIEIRGINKNYSVWTYEINMSTQNSYKAQLTQKSQECTQWLYDNFNKKQQKNNLIFKVEDQYFIFSVLDKELSMGTYNKTPVQNLLTCLKNVSKKDENRSNMNRAKIQAWIEDYGVMKEKQLLCESISKQIVVEDKKVIHKI